MGAGVKDRLFRLLRFGGPPGGDLQAPLDVSESTVVAIALKDAHPQRISALHRQLLAEFVLPNCASTVARSVH